LNRHIGCVNIWRSGTVMERITNIGNVFLG
jgi:hypothetical protein